MFAKASIALFALAPLISGAVIKHNDTALSARAELVVQPLCEGGNLDSHDCNVALLSLGGGIQGAIQFLRVDDITDTASSGSCTMTVTAVDGGTAIDISKGRLEQAQKSSDSSMWTSSMVGHCAGRCNRRYMYLFNVEVYPLVNTTVMISGYRFTEAPDCRSNPMIHPPPTSRGGTLPVTTENTPHEVSSNRQVQNPEAPTIPADARSAEDKLGVRGEAFYTT